MCPAPPKVGRMQFIDVLKAASRAFDSTVYGHGRPECLSGLPA
jgi:hypothetical protein